MKIRIINSSKEISRLDPKERVVHVSFPLTTSALLELAKKCPKLEGIQVPPSRLANMGGRSLILLEVLGVRIFEGSIQGYRTDRAEYITIDDGLILQRAGELRAEGWTPGRSWRKWRRRRGYRRGWWGSSWVAEITPQLALRSRALQEVIETFLPH